MQQLIVPPTCENNKKPQTGFNKNALNNLDVISFKGAQTVDDPWSLHAVRA